jgi:hypothetical protein
MLDIDPFGPSLLEVISGTIQLTHNSNKELVVEYWTHEKAVRVPVDDFAQHAADSREEHGDEIADFLISRVKQIGHAMRLMAIKVGKKEHGKRHSEYEGKLAEVVFPTEVFKWEGLTTYENPCSNRLVNSRVIALKNFLVDMHMLGLEKACELHRVPNPSAVQAFLEKK